VKRIPVANSRRALVLAFFALVVCLLKFTQAQEKPIQQGEREMARAMLNEIRQDLAKNYYDPKFQGLDVQARFKEADDRIKQATSLNQALGTVAWALEGLHDSHTFFIPPPRPFRLDYGWQAAMIGDKCFVIAVRPGSDADQKELRPGDLVETINRIAPSRENFWSLNYILKILRPQPGFELVVVNPAGNRRTVAVAAKIQQGKITAHYTAADFGNDVREAESAFKRNQRRSYVVGNDVIVWKLPSFELDEKGVDAMFAESSKYKGMVLDLRQDPGGFELSVLHMIGSLFDHDVKVGSSQTRKGLEPLVAKSRGDRAYKGKFVLLIDSASASASEILARVVQMEKRGPVIGDTSSGSVMSARVYSHVFGIDTIVSYAAEISAANLIMADGKSLEKSGVVPDETILPTGADLAASRDPVLSRAVTLAGASISPEDAGKLFPVEWPKL
jgi:C-terminal processing protease CtpA/Prc